MVFITKDREEAYALEDRFLKQNADNPLMLNSSIKGKGILLRKGSREYLNWLKNRNESQRRMYEAMSIEERKAVYGRKGPQNGMFGKTHSDDVKLKASERNKGNSYAKGSKRSEAQRKAISERAKERKGDKNPFFGKKHSEESRKRQSLAKKENPRIPGNARRISIDGNVYESLAAAKRATGVSQALLIHRIKSNKQKYSGYHYVQ